MVAILILGIALTGLVHGLTTALASNKQSELQTIAALFAQGKMEELRAGQILKNGEDDGDCGAVLPLYHWRQTISPRRIFRACMRSTWWWNTRRPNRKFMN